ncbi:MAG TPA: hypothetical protein VG268_09030, partial [Streptosporangiaceae bacterium]|nr:hypothetical protein [Streptosporangiaceae bacterium]
MNTDQAKTGEVSTGQLNTGQLDTGQLDTGEWLRRGAAAMAAGRVGLGVLALARPAVLTGAWVGPSGQDHAGRVLGRALGGRDLALGLGTLAALRRPDIQGASPAATSWMRLAALSDGFDLLITVGSWRRLPARQRWLVALSSGGATAVGL